MDFLSGNDEDAEVLLTEKMNLAVEREYFERALIIRDKLKMISKLKEKKITSISRFISADIIAEKNDGIFTAISSMLVRSGRMSGVKTFSVNSLAEDSSGRLKEFISRYYGEFREIAMKRKPRFSTGFSLFIFNYQTL